jgi:hypothetical protein
MGLNTSTNTNFLACRFGKTISVSMFAAAMLYSCPGLELSIYSTCKVKQEIFQFFLIFIPDLGLFCQRISQKLLRNVQKFLELIYEELRTPRMKEIRINMEEIVLQGDEDGQDTRMVNSYPSKVNPAYLAYARRVPRASSSTKPQCSSLTVSFLQSSTSREHLSNLFVTTSSAASCRASVASRWNLRSDFMPAAIS